MNSVALALPIGKLLHSAGRQLILIDLLQEYSWRFDLSTGILAFGNQYKCRTQVIGTESQAPGTWLWAWANTASNIPAHLLTASLALKAYGEQHGIPELTTPQLPLDQIDPHTLALLASGICEANAYYRCPYDGGALYVLITDDNFPKCPDPPLQRIATVFPQAIASLDLPDHRLALTGYLDHYGLAHERDGDTVVVRENGKPVLTAAFDDLNRLTSLEVRLEPQADTSEEGHAGATPPPEGTPAVRPPTESWDEAQLRRMLGG